MAELLDVPLQTSLYTNVLIHKVLIPGHILYYNGRNIGHVIEYQKDNKSIVQVFMKTPKDVLSYSVP